MAEAAPRLIERQERRHAAELAAAIEGPPPSGLRWWVGKPEVAAIKAAKALMEDDTWGQEADLRFLFAEPRQGAKTEDPRPYHLPSCTADEWSDETAPWIVEHALPILTDAIRRAFESLPTETAWREYGQALRGECPCSTDPTECMGNSLESAHYVLSDDACNLLWLRYYVRKDEIAEWDSFAWRGQEDLLPPRARDLYLIVARDVIGL